MSIDLGLFVLRLAIGLLLAGHGAQKLFGAFGGPGLVGFGGWLASMGLRPARIWAVVAGLGEFGGGLLLAFGLLNPLGSLAIMGSMLMAIATVHWDKGLWATNGGYEFPLVLLVVAGVVGLVGPGTLSLDAALGIALPMPATFWLGLAAVVATVVAGLASRTQPGRERTA